jgi:hypothetical protein
MKHSLSYNKMLEETKVLPDKQKRDLKVREAALTEAQACGLYPHSGWDLLEESEELRECMAGVKDEHITKAEELVVLGTEASKALLDLNLPPFQGVP